MPTAAVSSDVLDDILRVTLRSLVDELHQCDHFVRERDVINLFTFGYLVPAFQAAGLDLTLIGMEAAVFQAKRSPKSKLGAYKDLVIWREPRDSRFKGCDVRLPRDCDHLREHGCKPLAIIEWKNISSILTNPASVRAGHGYDIGWLQDNLKRGMLEVGYAILVDQCSAPTLTCRRLTATTNEEFLRL